MQQRSARVRMCQRSAVEFRLQPGNQCLVHSFIRSWPSWRRHGTVPQSPENLLPDLGLSGNWISMDCVEHQTGCFADAVVTRDAVLADRGTMGWWLHSLRPEVLRGFVDSRGRGRRGPLRRWRTPGSDIYKTGRQQGDAGDDGN